MQPTAFTGRQASLLKDSHNVQRHNKGRCEPRTPGIPSAQAGQIDLQGAADPDNKEVEVQLPPERIDSIDSYTESHYSHSSHSSNSSHSTASSASFPLSRTCSFATSVSHPDSDDDAANQQRRQLHQRHYSLPAHSLPTRSFPTRSFPVRTLSQAHANYVQDMDVSTRKGSVSAKMSSSHSLPVEEASVWSAPSAPQPSSVPSSPSGRTTPGRATGKPEETGAMASSPECAPNQSPCCHLPKAVWDDNNVTCDARAPKESTRDLEECQSVEGAATPNSSSSSSGQETPPRQWPGDRLTEEVCDTLLRDAFGVELQDLPAHMAVEAWEPVNICLEQLSNLLGANKSLGFSLPIRVAAQDPPCGSKDGSDCPQGNGQGRGNGLDRGRKRPKPPSHPRRNDDGDNGGDGDDGNDDSDDEQSPGKGPGRKKPKVDEPPDQQLSCPYRKRNPLRFNIRDHMPCATASFIDIPAVKRHVRLHHRRGLTIHGCPRCNKDLKTKDALRAHLKAESYNMCHVVPDRPCDDPEDGITDTIEGMLNGRKLHTKIDNWHGLWKALFPNDSDNKVPSPEFLPPVELPEIRWEFDNAAADLRRRVETEAQAIPDLSHEAQCHTAAQMQAALCGHVSLVLQDCQLHVAFAPRRRHRQQHHDSTSPGTGSSGCQPVGPHPFPPSTPRRIAPVAPLHAWPASVGSSLSSLSSAASSYVTTPSEPQQQQQQQLSQHQLQQQQHHHHHGQQPYLQLHQQYQNQLLPPSSYPAAAAAAADGAPEKRPKGPPCRDSGVVLEREDSGEDSVSVTGSYLELINVGDFSDRDGFTAFD